MSKFSVKKPLTVFVAVIAVLVLGVVSYLNMTPDLLPNMDFPYIMIMTTYPGASPEKVETELTKPLEQSMSTLEHILEVTSTSSENYSMVLLEFEEGTNLDTVGVDIQQSIASLSASWGDMVGAPYVLKINPSLLPITVAAVSMEGMDTVSLTEFLNGTLMNKLEGVPGVARISTSGAIQQQMHILLDQQKIDRLNRKITDAINGKMDEALEELTSTRQELEDAQAQMEDAQEQLEAGKDALAGQTAAGEAELSYQQAQLVATKAQLQDQLIQLQTAKQQLQATLSLLKGIQSALDQMEGQAQGFLDEIEALLGLQDSLTQLEALRDAMDAQLEAIKADTSKTQEEIDAAVAQFLASAEYQQLEVQLAQVKAALAAYGIDPEGISQRVEMLRQSAEELSEKISQLEGTLGEMELNRETLDNAVAEMEANLLQIEEGEAAIAEGLAQIDSGMLEMKAAAALLSQKKTEGLLELTSAANELAISGSQITAALTQVEGGISTLEDTREQTLAQMDLSKMLTLETLSGILTAQNFAMPAGYVQQDGISYMVSIGEEITDAETVEQLLLFDLGMEGLDPIYLSDVAAVMVTDNRNETYARLNGLTSVVLTFEKQSTYATAEATDNILARFEDLEAEYPGLQFVPLMNQGDYIYMIVESILSSLLLGALLAILILLLFLKDLRPTFITLCSIPISVIFAIVLMYFSGVTINMISLSGLAVAVGMLVDNSVVVIENIYRLRSKGANAIQAAVSGAGQVVGAVTASTLTTVCVFLPIVFVQGITRQLFTDLALTMTYSLLASLIVALTLVPAMASGLLKKEKKIKTPMMDKLLAGYRKAAGWALDHKAIVLISSLVLLLVTGVFSISKGFIFMPAMDMPTVNISVSMPENATMEEAVTYADEVLARIDTLEGIESVGAMMSSGGLLGGGTQSYDVTIYVNLSDEKASGNAVGQRITELCQDLPCTVSASSAMMDMSMLTGSGISLRIYSNSMEDLQTAARAAAEALSQVSGVAEVSDGLEDAAPALHIRVDRNKAMAKGITVAQIYMELASALQNTASGPALMLDGTTTSVILEKAEETRLDAEQLEKYVFSVTTQTGETREFPLSDVAVIEETTSLTSIQRISQRRYLTVSATLEEGRNVTLATTAAQRAIANTEFPQGVSYAFSGENESIMEAVEQLLLMLLLGVLLVYLVMVAQFQSLKSPFIVMFTIPLAFTGGFLALLICGMEVSVISLIGFVMLTGIIVNNGIVLVDYINQLRLEGTKRREAILEAGATRMRPILMTTVTTVLGLLDMALSRNVGTALMQPIAVVCIGGLVYATLMTLFVVPCIYDMLNKKELRKVDEKDLKLLDM